MSRAASLVVSCEQKSLLLSDGVIISAAPEVQQRRRKPPARENERGRTTATQPQKDSSPSANGISR